MRNLIAIFRSAEAAVFFLCLLAAVLLVASPASGAVAAPGEFETANREYSQGDFKAARTHYEALVKTGPWSANLFYNLGDADFRLNEKGEAFLAYERALALDPSHPEAQANLNRLRDETGARLQALSWWEQILEWPEAVAGNLIPWVVALAFWCFCFSLAPMLWRKRAGWFSALVSLAAILVLAWCGTAIAWRRSRGNTWIVTAKLGSARVEPADSSELAASLPMGSHLQLLWERGAWLYVQLPDRSRGWIARSAVEPVVLHL
jgi:tetratricopeptide (TPR) repeat protein